jgi:hypothetical protein
VIGFELGLLRGEQLVRFVRALGRHRYVASRLHLVHAFVFEAVEGTTSPALADAVSWAERATAEASGIDPASKDERLYRRASDAELASVLEVFWGAGPAAEEAKVRLRARLAAIGAAPDESATPFDEAREDDVFPVLVDGGWELLPLARLDVDRHKGAIQAFDDLEVARFEEESAIPPIVTLHELPILGGLELLAALDAEGTARAPFVLWQQGHEAYLDYVLRGVLRAAKIDVD